MTLMSLADQDRVSAAIAEAETRTSGEIVAVIAARSGSYLWFPVMIAATVALLIPAPFIFLTWWPIQWIYALQLATFAVLLLALAPPPVRFRLVPRFVLIDRAHKRAVEQFLSQNLHTTQGRTGVLVFVSEAERYAEILADVAIHEKVSPSAWKEIVDDLTAHIGRGEAAEGFIRAVRAVGELLAQHFPPGAYDPDELPNHLIVLD